MSRYDPPAEEGDFEPGSNGLVLPNLLGITDPRRMELVESQELAAAQEVFYEEFEFEHQFSVLDLCDMHRDWLGEIYPFAGRIRTVDIGKDGFQFASVQFLESNLARFESEFLRSLTPCQEGSMEQASESIAKVHGEFIMLHPFREGNGRLGRWVADAMAAQAGFPLPKYGFEPGDQNGLRSQYLAAVKRAARLVEYDDLSRFFAGALSRALAEVSPDH